MKLIDLTEKIDNVNDEIVGTYQTTLREAEIRKTNLEKLISKENNSITSNERNLKKAIARLNDLKSDFNQAEKKVKNLEVDATNAEAKLNELNETSIAQQVEVENAEREYNESSERSKQLNADESGTVKRVVELRDETERIRQRLEYCSIQINIISGQVFVIFIF